ncbi:MAG TPA: LacI family DNA-binding transcriptional regulator [Terriglobia bacterium]|nr:LacI family DNA-binding transcriptional regulator [Terriglobia bacterium]
MSAGRKRTSTHARRVGVQDIADALGISCGTVDRALHDRDGVNPATKRAVLSAARRLGYRPNLAARYLSSRKHLTIGVSLPLEVAHFFDDVREGIVEAASAYEPLGVKILYRPYKRFGQHEVEALRDILEEDISGLVVAPAYHERLRADMERAIRRGIPTVCVVSDAPGTGRLTSISVDPFTNGALAGELMAHLLAGDGGVIVFIGMHAAVDHEQKLRGFENSLKRFCPRGKILSVVEAHDEEDEAYQKCRRELALHPSARGIYVATANSIPVIRALDELGLSGKIKVIGTDLFPAMVPFIEAGKIAATIHQRPREQGLTAIRTLVRFLTEGLRPPARILLDPAIVMRSNLGLFFGTQASQAESSPR